MFPFLFLLLVKVIHEEELQSLEKAPGNSASSDSLQGSSPRFNQANAAAADGGGVPTPKQTQIRRRRRKHKASKHPTLTRQHFKRTQEARSVRKHMLMLLIVEEYTHPDQEAKKQARSAK